jgi:hypothetical protein
LDGGWGIGSNKIHTNTSGGFIGRHEAGLPLHVLTVCGAFFEPQTR